MRTSLSTALFALAVSFLSANAQAPAALDGPGFSLTAEQLIATGAAIPAKPMTDVTVLYEETSYRIAPAGSVTYAHRMIYRIETQNGVEGWSEISMQWDPWLDNQAQLRSRVLPRGASAFLELDPKTITDAPVNSEEDETYTNSRVRKAPLPGVAVGAIVEEYVSTEEKQPFFNAGGVYRDFFGRRVPIAREKLIVELPAAMPFRHKESYLPSIAVTEEQHDGLRRVVFDQGPLEGHLNSDIDLASPDPRLPLVEFSTGDTWQTVASSYSQLSDPQIILGEVKSLLPSPLPADRMKTIEALVQRLHKEVRYTGIEFGDSKLTPQHPSEVLTRHYGDCKDKATLLVAMLRAAGIPANLALLSAGPGRDVNPDLPGMNQFNHAIVYVPAAGSAPELWIDATASFAQVGTLPYQDYNRAALIIAPGTKQLSATPSANASSSVLIETRTFTLAENGPSHIVESSETHGFIDATYRSSYGGADTRRRQEELDRYAHNAYLAKTLAHIDHSDGADLSKPFHLTLDMTGARRGISSLSDAVVAIFPAGPTNNLDNWFSQAPPVLGPDATEAQRKDLEMAKQARNDKYFTLPQTYEQRYRILYPASFIPRALPQDKTTALGPAQLTETYSSTEPGVVTAILRLTLDKPLLTQQEALDLRDAAVALHKRDAILIYFDQQGAKLIAAGKVREGLAVDQTLIAQHAKEAVHHLRLANALLEAGMGLQAKVEAREATKLEPGSAISWSTLAWILEHDDIAVRFGEGYDRAGAIAAYRKAAELDPEDNDIRFNLAILYEFDAHGVRYSADASLSDAMATYRALIDKNKDTDESAASSYRDNLLFAMLFSHQYDEVTKLCQQLPSTTLRNAIAITATVAQHDVATGRALADRFNSSAAGRNTLLRSAGQQLSELRLYSKAAEILSAGIQGDSNAANAARQIDLFRNLQPVSLDPLPASDPRAPLHTLVYSMMSDTLTSDAAGSILSRHAYGSDQEWNRFLKKLMQGNGMLRQIAATSELTTAVLQDIVLGTMKINASGDDATGHPIVSQTTGSAAENYFVVKEESSYKLLSSESGDNDNEVGNYVLYLLDRNQPNAAKAILDWKRDQLHKQGGDDSLSGPLLTRFWTVGDAADPEALRLAAASLLPTSLSIKPLLPHLAELRNKAPAAKSPLDQRTSLNLLLSIGYVTAGDADHAIEAVRELLTVQSDSDVALGFAGNAFSLKNDAAGWNAILDPLLAKHPQDPGLLRHKARAQELQKDYAGARKTFHVIFDSGKANSNDYNNYAWIGLFDNKLDDETTQAAQQSNMLSKNGSFASLHTLACIYAAQGKTTEARKVIEQAMSAGNVTQPNPEVWFALGLVYEQYGVNDAALNAYAKVEPMDNPNMERINVLSTYTLAQERIQRLKAAAAQHPAATKL